MSETTEPQHSHVCPICMDAWQHANSDCEPVYGDKRETWAKCPEHEGMEPSDV